MFDRTGFGARLGADRLHPTVAAAVDALLGEKAGARIS